MSRQILLAFSGVAAACVLVVAAFFVLGSFGTDQRSDTTAQVSSTIPTSTTLLVTVAPQADVGRSDAGDPERPDAYPEITGDGDASAIKEIVMPILESGRRHCWAGPADGYEMVVEPDGSVSFEAYVTDDSIDRKVTTIETGSGRFITESEVSLQVETWSATGFSTTDTVYVISGDRLEPALFPGLKVAPADCSVFDQATAGTSGLNIGLTETVAFTTGTSGASLNDAIIRGEVAVYRLEASKGQTMTATISSLESNAAASVFAPGGHLISDNEDGSGSRSFVLPQSGVYEVVVSSIRGNATFTLEVTIS